MTHSVCDSGADGKIVKKLNEKTCLYTCTPGWCPIVDHHPEYPQSGVGQVTVITAALELRNTRWLFVGGCLWGHVWHWLQVTATFASPLLTVGVVGQVYGSFWQAGVRGWPVTSMQAPKFVLYRCVKC